MNAASVTSETVTDVVNFAAPVTVEVPDANVTSAVSSFLTLFRNSENSFIQNQISQSNHSANTELDRSIEPTLQQTSASSRHIDDQNSSNSANDTLHSVAEEPTPHRQQFVPVAHHDSTEMKISMTEATSAIMLEDKSASHQQQPKPLIDSASNETLPSMSPNGHSTQ